MRCFNKKSPLSSDFGSHPTDKSQGILMTKTQVNKAMGANLLVVILISMRIIERDRGKTMKSIKGLTTTRTEIGMVTPGIMQVAVAQIPIPVFLRARLTKSIH